MYGRGIRDLLQALPRLSGLDNDQVVRRLLSRAWLELAEARELGATSQPNAEPGVELRRLALALQVHGFVLTNVSSETLRATAFVAAEALDIARGFELEPYPDHERVVVGLLYMVAGYDANAAVAARDVEFADQMEPFHRYALSALRAFLTGGPPPVTPAAVNDEEILHERVRKLLWRELGQQVTAFLIWLRDPRVQTSDARTRLADLANAIRALDVAGLHLGNGDIDHLLSLSIRAMDAAAARALRDVSAPQPASEPFADFLIGRCRSQPLLWPAAAGYAEQALPGPSRSAIVAVPTGAGKSAVADLAVQHAATAGWVLYLAPTNALVSQIRRQLRTDHQGLTIREFFGGAEYTTLDGETLQNISAGQVFVMTPEKCSLALRQSPAAFATMSLCVLDEAHLLADAKGRGQLTELVLSEVLARAPGGQMLLMSALIANPDALAAWLSESHRRPTVVIREPWRPTRTLRAVVGVEDQAVQAAAEPAVEQLERLPPRRRNVKFNAPLAALAGLYGPWATTEEADYALVRVATTVPVNVTRPAGGGEIEIDLASLTVRPTVEALAQLLAERGQKVIAFLPRSRHDSFAAALSMAGFGEVELSADVEALLLLASAELGVPSRLMEALRKGVAVHTSALLAEERRASELAFETDIATVLFATGTLAQGLNLPATTVIIGGTEIGYAPDQSRDEKRDRARAQLLNAIGRAGRARVAARSLALVVPTKLPVFDEQTPATSVLERAEFLAEEDASTNVLSSLRDLLQQLLSDRTTVDDIRDSDQIALSYLAPVQQEDDLSQRVLGGTWAVHQLRIQAELPDVTRRVAELTAAAVSESEGPAWASEVARRAAVPLSVAARFATYIRDSDLVNSRPATVEAWASTLVAALRELGPEPIDLLLFRDAFASTALEAVRSEDGADRDASFAALESTLSAWLDGSPLAVVGGEIHGSEPLTSAGRGQQDPLPRTIRTIEQGLGFGITRAAGALAAAIDVAVESGEIDSLPDESQAALELLPLALRYGAVGTALAFTRAGARPRAVAHLIAGLVTGTPLSANAEELLIWARREMESFIEQLPQLELSEANAALLHAFVRVGDIR
jgi:superfamily II DNA/RNA helicase